jgi:hydroxymethylglutaryl-CoA reductase (NADPH)
MVDCDQLFEDVLSGKLSGHKLEEFVNEDYEKAIEIRRRVLASHLSSQQIFPILENIPMKSFRYEDVIGQCCENVIGYLTMPLGIVGPLKIDGVPYFIPMATTEGALIASTQRGTKALTLTKEGVTTIVYGDGMTRGPVVQFPSIIDVLAFKVWLQHPENYARVKHAFNGTSRFARLQSLDVVPAGVDCFLRFKAKTGDAMGMNMVSKGTEKALSFLKQHFPSMTVISLSGNYCTDKKAASLNWIDGRGKSVIASAILSPAIIKGVLKVTPDDLMRTHLKKNFKGSAMAGSLGGGGFNAQASNVVTAIFLATGQDPAQNIVSANCLTELEFVDDDDEDAVSASSASLLTRNQEEEHAYCSVRSIRVTCTMPSIEVGTVGGGTNLSCQKACLSIMGLSGPSTTPPSPMFSSQSPISLYDGTTRDDCLNAASQSSLNTLGLECDGEGGSNAQKLARIVCATVLAGEISLLAALTEGSLMQAHLALNRKNT